MKPDLSKLYESRVWIDAGTQVDFNFQIKKKYIYTTKSILWYQSFYRSFSLMDLDSEQL